MPRPGGMGCPHGSVGSSIHLTVRVGCREPHREFCALVTVLNHFLNGGINVNDKVYLNRQKYYFNI